MGDAENTVVQVPPMELKRHLDGGAKVALLDVREPFEREHCRILIPEASGVVDLHVPMGEIPLRLDEIADAVQALAIVVYCHHGVRSLMIARWLAARGFRCGNLVGGIDAWSSQVDPSVPTY